MIVNRKSWGGNRTWNEARAQQTVISVIRTARQQGIDPVDLRIDAQHHTKPAPSNVLRLPARDPPNSLAA